MTENKHEGIFAVEQSTMKVSGTKLTRDDDGKLNFGTPKITMRTDVCPIWLEIALDHVFEAKLAAEGIERANSEVDSDALGKYLKKEMRAGMQAAVATCIGLDAFYSLVLPHAGIADSDRIAWSKKRTARYARMLECFRRAFDIPDKSVDAVRDLLKEMFRFRDMEVHPPQESMEPELHPEAGRVVDWKYATFRHYNSDLVLRGCLNLLAQLLPRATEPGLVKVCLPLNKRIDSMNSRLGNASTDAEVEDA